MKERPQKRGFSNNFPPNRSRKSTRSWGPAFGEPLWPQDEKRNRSFRRPFTSELRNQDAQPDIPWEDLVSGDRDDTAYGHRHIFDPVARAKHEAYMFGKPLTEVEGEGQPEQQEALHPKADSSEVDKERSEEETSIQAKCDCEKKEEEAVNLKADSPAPTVAEPESEEEISLKTDSPTPTVGEQDSEEEISLKADSPAPTVGEQDSEEEISLKADSPAPTVGEQDSEEEISLKAETPAPTESEQDSEEEISLKTDSPGSIESEHNPEEAINLKPDSSTFEDSSENLESSRPGTEELQMKEESKSFLEHAGDFGKGFYEGGKDTVTGLGSMAKGAWNLTGGWATNPEEAQSTWNNLKFTAKVVKENPGAVLEGIKEPYVKALQEGRPGEAIGRGTFEALSMVVGTKGLDKLAKGSKFAGVLNKTSKVTNAVNKTNKVARATSKLGKIISAINKGQLDDLYQKC